MKRRKVSENGIRALKLHERCVLKAYCDPASPRGRHRRATGLDDPALDGSPWTIGYGHTGPEVTPGMRISQATAEQILSQDLALVETCLNRCVRVELTQQQFDALASWTFNVGREAASTSRLIRLLNAGDVAGAAAQFPRWKYAGGRVEPILVTRRVAERELFLAGLTA